MEYFKTFKKIGGRLIPVLRSLGAVDLWEGLCQSVTQTRGSWLGEPAVQGLEGGLLKLGR